MKIFLLLLAFFTMNYHEQPHSIDTDIIISKSKTLHFSSQETKDSFTILIVGKSILEGKMIFQILNCDGEELFREEYPSSYLIGYELVGTNPSELEKEEVLKKRISEFFSEEMFIEPAISEDDDFDPDYSEKAIWEDIKSDSSAVGFYYLVGEEQGCRIAYSKKMKKVVKYFCCC